MFANISPLLGIALIGTLCIFCQWTAWRYKLPAIVLLSIAGLILGPATGILNPVHLFGPQLQTLISIAVAIILFDGGLGLRFQELKEMRRAVLQMVLLGAPLGWLMASASCHFIAGLSWQVSLVFGGILVVTGPTVILPLLRQARLQPRAAAVLKWEGIVNDPLGAFFAVLAFEYIASPHAQYDHIPLLFFLAFKIIFIGAGSFFVGQLLKLIFHRGAIPEFLKQPVVLVTVLLTYAMANIMQDEGGLIAVTVLGITLANSNMSNLDEMRRFKEYLSLLLVSLVFILITATLRVQDIALLGWRDLAFMATLLLLVRPITVLSSAFGSGMTRQELLFIGWIAPRGVVCAAVSGLFAPQLIALGYTDANKLVPLAFGIVFATVIGHGFTLRPWGKKLGLIHDQVRGLLLVGCNRFTVELAEKLKELDIPVIISDRNWYHLRHARQQQIPQHYGEVLSEDAEFTLEMNRYGALIAATDNPSYNALLAARFAHEFGHENTYRLAVEPPNDNQAKASSATVRVQPILGGLLYDEVMDRLIQGWKIKSVRITQEYPYSMFKDKQKVDFQPILSLASSGIIVHAGAHANPAESGYILVVFTSPTEGEPVVKQ